MLSRLWLDLLLSGVLLGVAGFVMRILRQRRTQGVSRTTKLRSNFSRFMDTETPEHIIWSLAVVLVGVGIALKFF